MMFLVIMLEFDSVRLVGWYDFSLVKYLFKEIFVYIVYLRNKIKYMLYLIIW